MNGKRSLNQQIKNIVYADGNGVREEQEKNDPQQSEKVAH